MGGGKETIKFNLAKLKAGTGCAGVGGVCEYGVAVRRKEGEEALDSLCVVGRRVDGGQGSAISVLTSS